MKVNFDVSFGYVNVAMFGLIVFDQYGEVLVVVMTYPFDALSLVIAETLG